MTKRKDGMVSIYMHTINGHPAGYDGDQVCYHWQGQSIAEWPRSLAALRREQKKCMEWRTSQGMDAEAHEYGYRRYTVPAAWLEVPCD